jgi:hypothetical protein
VCVLVGSEFDVLFHTQHRDMSATDNYLVWHCSRCA